MAKKKAVAKKRATKGNGWGVLLKTGKLQTHIGFSSKRTLPTEERAKAVAELYAGARAVRVQVEPVEAMRKLLEARP